MNPERFKTIKITAMRMAGEIEWFGFAGPSGAGRRMASSAEIAANPSFIEGVRSALGTVFTLLERSGAAASVVGHQEVELEAAGLVASAVKHVLLVMEGAVPPTAGEASSVRVFHAWPLITKFRTIRAPVIQAAPGVWVPSMEEQLQGAKPRKASDQ